MKRTLVVVAMSMAIVLVAEPLQTVHGIIMTHAEIMALESADAVAKKGRQDHLQNGNGFVKSLSAPFRAIGRLFGGGNKKTKNKLERISKKDMEQFQSVPSRQTSKASSLVPTAQPTAGSSQTEPLARLSVHLDSTNSSALAAAAHLEKGRAMLDQHDLNGAIAELSLAMSLDPKSGEAKSLLGVAYWRKGFRDRARKAFEDAVQTDNPDPQHLNNLGYLLYESGEYEKATKYLKRAAKLSPNDARIMNNLALAQSERGHYDDAFKSFARALGEFRGHVNIAQRLERHGENKKAIKHLEKARALQPHAIEVLARLVELYRGEGKEQLLQSTWTSLVAARSIAAAPTK